MRSGVTIVNIPGSWYIAAELTGPVERGSQSAGLWTGLAGASLGIRAGTKVDASVLTYLVGRFGGFDVVIASDDSSSARHAHALAEARQARQSGDVSSAHIHEQHATAIWDAFDQRAKATLLDMQRSGARLTDHHAVRSTQVPEANLGHEWIVASFRHDTDDETGEPLLHTHNVVPAIIASD